MHSIVHGEKSCARKLNQCRAFVLLDDYRMYFRHDRRDYDSDSSLKLCRRALRSLDQHLHFTMTVVPGFIPMRQPIDVGKAIAYLDGLKVPGFSADQVGRCVFCIYTSLNILLRSSYS